MPLLSLVFIYLALCECWGSHCLGFLHPLWEPLQSWIILLTFLLPLPLSLYTKHALAKERLLGILCPFPPLFHIPITAPLIALSLSIPFHITTRFPCYYNSLSFFFSFYFQTPLVMDWLIVLVYLHLLSLLKTCYEIIIKRYKNHACLLKFRITVGILFS